jgi:hypothetical protein
VKILSRQNLLEQYYEILARNFDSIALAEIRATGNYGPSVIVQTSSGTSGNHVLRLPRSKSDIADIFQRTLVPYLELFQKPPKRIAMLGGISHTEAALKMDLGGIQFRSFLLEELAELEAFEPEVISCYPNLARELYRNPHFRFPSLKAFKLGGEQVLQADLEQIEIRFGKVAVFEQVGSTEMPALAIGLRTAGTERKLRLQTRRFSFAPGSSDVLRPLVVKDNFPQLLFSPGEYYDTGDLAVLNDAYLFDLRRAGSDEFKFWDAQNSLIRAGATNMQFDLERETVRVEASGEMSFPESVEAGGNRFQIQRGPISRVSGSNKIRLLKARNSS